ncbi:hypothetical protein [Solirubrum puertoriconensis]|uniref:Lipoprotein n=1 Tax=Solirubrum puertoriconensis TaxID=1751427 RepID=A0A9X0L5B4_SOLP1|nr:hypothetical protein [Solirubrum puertoriconensis]KUG08569.1 hypothetical protein ASU33_10465 [Solirubrum puertoriconensis]
MKSYYLGMVAAALLVAGCNQSAPSTEQANAAAGTTEQAAAADSTNPAAATEGSKPAAAPTAPAPVAAQLSFRFEPVKDADSGPKKTTAYLVIKGSETKEIDLGRFAGKPDVIDEAKAKRAEYPSNTLVGFRSYDPNTGTGEDVSVTPGDGARLRIQQRRIDEQADKPFTFQIAREIPLPDNTVVQVAPLVKK